MTITALIGRVKVSDYSNLKNENARLKARIEELEGKKPAAKPKAAAKPAKPSRK